MPSRRMRRSHCPPLSLMASARLCFQTSMPSRTWQAIMPNSVAGETSTSPLEIRGHLAGLVTWLVGDVARDIVGLAGGDWVHELRTRKLSRLLSHRNDALNTRKVDLGNRQVDPNFVRPLFKAAATESEDEMLKLWAELL